MMQESRNPIYGASDNALDVLRSMALEIREGIYSLSRPDVPESEIEKDIDDIAKASHEKYDGDEKSSTAVLSLSLFRKYAEIANQIKDSKQNDGFLADLPSIVHVNDDLLTGWSALGERIFWLRLSVSCLAFISFVVMSTVPYIDYAEFAVGRTLFVSLHLLRLS